MRYKVVKGSTHECCYTHSVIDTIPDNSDFETIGFHDGKMIKVTMVCAAVDFATAQKICDALNKELPNVVN